MSGWRDFALRGSVGAMRAMGRVVPNEICGADHGFARTKG
jgi:hypothetical protein